MSDSVPPATADLVAAPPDVPPVLTQHIQQAIAAVAPGQSLSIATPAVLLRAAESLFSRTLRTGCTDRTSAVALLVVDALVTYAFERASDEPAEIEARAAQAIAALAGLAGSEAR